MKKRVIYEIIFYLIIPLIIWNLSRKEIGNYFAMLLTTVPGLIYTIWALLKDKQYNITGIFILCSLFVGRILDILSGTAESMLWNDIYINIAYLFFWIITIIIRKPMGMYFFIDYAYLQGFPREDSKMLYRRKELYKYFQLFTAFFALRDLENVILKTWAIKKYGVEGFNQISIIMSINGYISTGLMILLIMFIIKKIKIVAGNKPKQEDLKEVQKG